MFFLHSCSQDIYSFIHTLLPSTQFQSLLSSIQSIYNAGTGAGITGLIAARDLVEAGIFVHILESSDRIGGRIYSMTATGTSQVVDLGAEWLHLESQPNIKAELDRYGIETTCITQVSGTKGGHRYEKKRWIYNNDQIIKNLSDECLPVPKVEESEYLRCMMEINYDVSILDVSQGYDQYNGGDFDLTYFEYVTKRLG